MRIALVLTLLISLCASAVADTRIVSLKRGKFSLTVKVKGARAHFVAQAIANDAAVAKMAVTVRHGLMPRSYTVKIDSVDAWDIAPRVAHFVKAENDESQASRE